MKFDKVKFGCRIHKLFMWRNEKKVKIFGVFFYFYFLSTRTVDNWDGRHDSDSLIKLNDPLNRKTGGLGRVETLFSTGIVPLLLMDSVHARWHFLHRVHEVEHTLCMKRLAPRLITGLWMAVERRRLIGNWLTCCVSPAFVFPHYLFINFGRREAGLTLTGSHSGLCLVCKCVCVCV